MALSLADIKADSEIRAPRILLLGVEKVGKSAFAVGSRFEDDQRVEEGLNDPIVLQFRGEEGVDDFAVPRFPVLDSFDQVMEALEVLYTQDHKHRTIVGDSITTLEKLIWSHLCNAYGVDSLEKVLDGFGKGFSEAEKVFRQFLDGLDSLRRTKGMGVILIGHVKVKTFHDPSGEDYDQYQLDAHEKIASAVMRWADLIMFATTKTAVMTKDAGFNKEKARAVDPTGGRRYLYTKKRPAHPGGGRGIYGELPFELPLDWAEFSAAVDKVITDRESRRGVK